MKRIMMLGLGLLLGAAAPALAADVFGQTRIGWNKPQAPFHLIGNIYYVGMAGVSAFLITTPEGDILTDGGLPESAPFIEKNIQTLGFKLSNVKILLNSHAHFDHAGGLAALKQATGGKLYASAQDKPFLESGRITFGPSVTDPFPPVKVDHVVQDGETISLGGATLTAHITPGHTPGCTTWTMPLKDGTATHHVMFFCSISVAGNPLTGSAAYPTIAQDYKASFAKLDRIQADIFLAPHGEQFGLADKLAKRKPGGPNPFINSGELHRYLAQAKKDYDTELAKQYAHQSGPIHH